MARIAPLTAPYPSNVEASLEALRLGLPEPLALFRTLARAPRVLERVKNGGLLDRGPVAIRLRELMILRTTARCGAGYEWGVHVAGFAHKAALSEVEVAATTKPLDAHGWGEIERLVLELADELHDTSRVSAPLWARLRKHFADDAVIELVALSGFYHLISFELNALEIEPEPWAPSMPRVNSGNGSPSR